MIPAISSGVSGAAADGPATVGVMADLGDGGKGWRSGAAKRTLACSGHGRGQ